MQILLEARSDKVESKETEMNSIDLTNISIEKKLSHGVSEFNCELCFLLFIIFIF
jgi:hypothetical protein